MTAHALPFAADDRPAHDPRHEIRLGAAIAGLFVVGFLGWSAVAHLDAAVHLPGVIRVAGNRQAVQSVTGGIVSALHVREGDHVAAGQVLVDFATVEALAQERSLASRVIGLQAEIARLDAEQAGSGRVVAPAAWATLTGAERDAAARALAGEQANLASRRALMGSQRAVLGQRLAEIDDQVGGYRERQASNLRQEELNGGELADVQQLYRKGFATRTRVLALQRSAASIAGDVGATRAEMARLRTSAGETRMQMMSLADQRDRDNGERLRAARTELDSLLPQWQAAREQLGRARVVAPASGAVLGLAANTVGGVAAAGQKLMEIVPDRRALQVEAQLSPGDAGDLHAGQRAEVRLAGTQGRQLPPLTGRIARVSADSLTDEHSGRTFYTATVALPQAEIARLERESGVDAVRSGTPVEVTVPTRSRSALAYLLDPLTARLRSGLNER